MLQQLNDSSLIISILESYRLDRTTTIEKLVSYYPSLESKNARGKQVFDYPNKYFIMYGDKGHEINDNKWVYFLTIFTSSDILSYNWLQIM